MNLELAFAKDLLKRLKEREDDATAYVTSSALPEEEYLVNVGYIRSIRETRHEFQEMLKQYFPNT